MVNKTNLKSAALTLALNSVAQQQSQLIGAIFTGEDNTGLNLDPRGLTIYRRNLQATAKRALSISFPTVLQLIGEQLFELASSLLLLRSPPEQGDWGLWGDDFADLLGQLPQLEDYPFVPDCARVDFLRHKSERATDHCVDMDSLQLLASVDIDELMVRFPQSLFIATSDYPVVELWLAHHGDPQSGEEYFGLAKDLLSQQHKQQHALIYRPQYKAYVVELDELEFRWFSLLQRGLSLGKALDTLCEVGESAFVFENWLAKAIEHKLISSFYQVPNA
jgi:hypothetical protein